MAFFYAPPPPSQSSSNTPPVPHEPQDGSASQPPFRQVQNVLAMALVLASWPASLEPRLQAPNNQQVKIAPLTRTYGDQPPHVGPLTPSEYAQIRLTWEKPWDAQRRPTLPPPTPVVVAMPPYVRPFMGRPEAPTWRQPPAPDTAPLTCQFVGLPAHDEFEVNYATSLGPCNWTQTAGQFGTDGLGHALPLNSGSNLAFWKETSFTPDQYCQVTVTAYNGDTPAPCVRVSSSGNDSYAMVAVPSVSTVTLYQTIAGVGTPIQAVSSVTLADGDVLKLRVVGSVLQMFLNGAQIGTDQVDTGITTGQPGIFVNHIGAASLLDNFIADQTSNPSSYLGPHPAGWLTPGIWAAAFPDVQLEVVHSNVVVPADNPDQPPVRGVSVPGPVRQWLMDWAAQRSATCAAWYVAPVVNTPTPVGPLSATDLVIVQSWPIGWGAPQRRVTRVQPSPGTPPTPQGPLSPTETTILVGQWTTTWPAQHARTMTATLPAPPPIVKPLSLANRIAGSTWPTGWSPSQHSPTSAAVIPVPVVTTTLFRRTLYNRTGSRGRDGLG